MTEGICPFAEWIPGVTKFSAGGPPKVGWCDHTAGGFFSTLTRASFWNDEGYSVHFEIARDGRVGQQVNIFDRAWGQGRDARGLEVSATSPGVNWPPFKAMFYENPNEYLISTEHEDAVIINGKTVFIPGSEWTTAQYNADLRVKEWCRDEFLRVKGVDIMPFGIDSLTGHHMFDPVSRAECPGRFWRDHYRQELFMDLTKPEVSPAPPAPVFDPRDVQLSVDSATFAAIGLMSQRRVVARYNDGQTAVVLVDPVSHEDISQWLSL